MRKGFGDCNGGRQAKLTEPSQNETRSSGSYYLNVMRAINAAETLDQLLAGIPDKLPDLVATYHHFGAVGAFDYKDSCEFHAYNVPENIENYLDAHRKYESNPAVVAVLSKGRAMWLSELVNDPYIINQDHVVLTKATMEMTGDALCLPLYGPNSRSGYMFIAFGMSKADCDDYVAFNVQALAQQFHVRYCLMLEKLHKQVKLTPREGEVLELITFGKSNSEIATILDISTSTVSGYVQRIFLKLDVSDRVSAAMRAQTLKVKL